MPLRTRFALLLSLVFALAASSAPARSDCYRDCQNQCSDASGNITSQECVNSCSRSKCPRPTVSYGSIAYGMTSHSAGWSYDYRDAAEADRVALASCAKHGDDCKTVLSFSNGCAAVAAGGGAYGTGEGGTRGEAQSAALSACVGVGGKDCEIRAWSCALP